MTPTTRDRISDERLSDAELQEYLDGFEQLRAIGIDATKDSDGLSVMRLVYEVKAHRAAEAQRPTWQPIAEHNGTRFVMLVGWTHSRDVQRGFFDSGIGGGMWRSADRKGHPLFDPQPTHRMPLPAPPDGGNQQ